MNQSIYTERENILPHHAEWLDGCGATWNGLNKKFSEHGRTGYDSILFTENHFQFWDSIDGGGYKGHTHIPTGTEFCERVAEILGLPKPTFEVDISKTETTTDHIPDIGKKVDEQDKLFPGRNNTMGEGSLTQEDIEILLGDSIVKSIKGMAIEVSRLGQADREWVVEVRNELCNWHMWKYCIYKEGRIKLGDVLDKDLTITESPTEFLEYVGKQTGKEYKKTAAYDVQKFVANREGMAERLAKAPFTNEELMDLPAEEIGKLNFGKPELEGMAIEVSRLSEEDRGYLEALNPTNWNWNWKYCVCSEKEGKEFNFINYYSNQLFKGNYTTESPTEFLKYVAKQTGKELKVKNKKGCKFDTDGDGNCHIHPSGCPKEKEEYKPMNNHQAVTSGTNDGLDDGPRFEDIAKALGVDDDSWKLRKPTYPHKTYRILDSLDGISFDTRIPLSEWIPPIVKEVLWIFGDEYVKGVLHNHNANGLIIRIGESKFFTIKDLDGHWMRIV